MFQIRSKRKAGFECGETGAKLVVLIERDGVLHVEHVFIEESPFEGRVKGSARPPMELTRLMLLHKHLPGCKTVFTAPGATDACFVILPKMNKAETEGAIHLQANKLVSWEADKPILAFAGSEFLRDRVGHLVGLADWKAVKSWGRIFEASGGLVDDVTVAACAFRSLARAQQWNNEFPVVLAVDIGAATSWFYVLDRHGVRFMRKVPVGGDAMTSALTTVISTGSGTFELTDIEAEEVKVTGSLPEPTGNGFRGAVVHPPAVGDHDLADKVPDPSRLEQLDILIRPVVERIACEITRSMQFFKDNAGRKVDAVFLTGGATLSASLRAHVEESLDVPVRVINPFAGLRFTNTGTANYAEKNRSRLAVAVGLALDETPAISLLPKRVQVAKRLAAFMPGAVAAVLILCFLPFLGFGINSAIKLRSLRNELKRCQPQITQAEEASRRVIELRDEAVKLSGSMRSLRDIIGRRPLWPGVLNAIADSVPEDVVLLRCGVGVDPRRPNTVLLGGSVLPSAGRFDNAMSSLLSALGSSVFFRRVSIIQAKSDPSPSSLGTFEIQCELVY